jgi:hypothetical protein
VPAKSKKQERFMQAVANNPKFAKKVGVPQSVGKEFTKVKKYNPGGKVITPKKEKARIKELAKQDRYKKILERDIKIFGPNEESKPAKDVDISTRKGFTELINKPVKKRAGGMLKTPDNPGLKKLPTEVRNKMGYMKKGGEVDKKLLRYGAKMLSSPKPKYFLEAAGEAAKNIKAIPPDMQKQKAKDKNKKLDRLIEQKTKIDRVKYGKKKGGEVKQMKKGGMVKRGDGCAVRGKTKGKMI